MPGLSDIGTVDCSGERLRHAFYITMNQDIVTKNNILLVDPFPWINRGRSKWRFSHQMDTVGSGQLYLLQPPVPLLVHSYLSGSLRCVGGVGTVHSFTVFLPLCGMHG